MTDQEWENAERETTRKAIAAMLGAVYWPEQKCYAVYNDPSEPKYYDLEMNKLDYDPFDNRNPNNG